MLGRLILCLVFAGLCAVGGPEAQSGTTAAAQSEEVGFRAEFLADLRLLENRVLSLADAIPQEKYTWRPAEGVRSVHEVLLHIATTNYSFPRMAGVEPPQGLDLQGLPSLSTDKSIIREALVVSFAHAREGVMQLGDEDLERTIQPNWTVRRILMFQLRHGSEHIGQLIAYARVQGITPPWTERQQRRQQ